MARNYILEQLKQKFKDQASFSRDELFDFFLSFEPNLKETTFRWRIYNLKTKKVIQPLSKNEFTLTYKPVFKPEIGETEQKISMLIQRGYPILKKSIISTKVINEFMLHQPSRFFYLLEVEKDALESVFYYLKERGIQNIFLQPEEKELQHYISDIEDAVVLRALLSKAPVQPVKKVITARLEKVLVDLFCDKKLFSAYQGSELMFIFNSAYRRYALDFTKLLGYAQRRNRENELIDFLVSKTDIQIPN